MKMRFLLQICSVLVLIFINYVRAISTREYLQNKLQEVKEQVVKSYIEAESVKIAALSISYNATCNLQCSIRSNESQPVIFKAFEKTFVLVKSGALLVDIDTCLINKVSVLREVVLNQSETTITFIKSFIWRTISYLLICDVRNLCAFYTGKNDFHLQHVASIRCVGMPVDANFFARDNRFYVIIANNYGPYIGTSTIYHVVGNNVTAVVDIITSVVVSVTTFSYRSSTIIIFAQDYNGSPTTFIEVYRFKENAIEKIQLLPANRRISVHSYYYEDNAFLLVVNEASSSETYWWDGSQFLKWLDFEGIRKKSLVKTIHFHEHLLLFVSENNHMKVYMFLGTSFICLQNMKLDNRNDIIDMEIQFDERFVIVTLVTADTTGMFHVELYTSYVNKVTNNEEEIIWKCLRDLDVNLHIRTSVIKNSSLLFSSRKYVNSTTPLKFSNLNIESSTVSQLELLIEDNSTSTFDNFLVIGNSLKTISQNINESLLASRNILKPNQTNILSGDIIIEGNAFFQKLDIDNVHVDILNDKKVDFENFIFSENDQNFSLPLRGREIVIQNLLVPSICGVPFEYWYKKNDTQLTFLNLTRDDIDLENDTVIFNSDLHLDILNTDELNNVNLKQFLQDIFIIDQNNVITGNITYNNTLNAENIEVQKLQGEPIENYLTKHTNQSLDEFYVAKLEVAHLDAEFINGVSPTEAARISKQNNIKGNVTIGNLIITDELILDSDINFSNIRPLQIYNNVKIKGDVTINNLQIEPPANFLVQNESVQISSLFKNFWTKTTAQIIDHPIIFENGITIDEIESQFVNDLRDEDFLYTTMVEIPRIFTGKLHFQELHANGGFIVEGETEGLFENKSDSLIFNEPIHITRLVTQNMIASKYNGIPVEDIINEAVIQFPANSSFERVIVNKQLIVGDLQVKFVGKIDVPHLLNNALYIDGDYEVDILKTIMLHAEYVDVDKINGENADDYMEGRRGPKIRNNIVDLIINGDLEIKQDLQVDFINNIDVNNYLKNLQTNDFVIPSNKKVLDTLKVHGNLIVKDLNGYTVQMLCNETLTKSGDQNLSGQFFFHTVTVKNISTNFLNGYNISEMLFTDQPLLIKGNLTFSNLHVKNDITTKSVNGYSVPEFYDIVTTIPIDNIDNLRVIGNVSWTVPSINKSSISYLLNYTVTADTEQIIDAPVVFESQVFIRSMNTNTNSVFDVNIRDIVNDAVVDEEEIFIAGKKTFKNNVLINNLTVSKDISIATINDWDILHLNKSIVRKYSNEIVYGKKIFAAKVNINKLQTKQPIHNVNLSSLILITDDINNTIHFEHLTIKKNASFKNLDGVDIDKFAKSRVTLTDNHKIFSNVKFDTVNILGHTTIKNINNIDTSDFVLNNANYTQTINSRKVFSQPVIVDGSIETIFINDVNITAEYEDSVLTNKDAVIYGDIDFENNILMYGRINVKKTINGLISNQTFDESVLYQQELLQKLNRSEKIIKASIENAVNVSLFSPEILFYLETEKYLEIPISHVGKVEFVQEKSNNKLYIFANQPGKSCGFLNDFCRCHIQYIVDLTRYGPQIWNINGTNLMYNIEDTYGVFKVNISSDTVSSSKECSKNTSQHEKITIFWKKFFSTNSNHTTNVSTENLVDVNNFLSDAKVFPYNDKIYIVLALYYNKTLKSHQVNSLIYEIDMKNETINLVKRILTNGATKLEIFKTADGNLHILIGCTGRHAKSQLYRLNPVLLQFELLRDFTIASQCVKSLTQNSDTFVILNDLEVNEMKIFHFNSTFQNFYFYQNFSYDSPINSIETFSTRGHANNDSYIIVTTKNGNMYIYEYMFIGKFQLKFQYKISGIQTAVPFYYMGNAYVFVGTSKHTVILRIITQGPRHSSKNI